MGHGRCVILETVSRPVQRDVICRLSPETTSSSNLESCDVSTSAERPVPRNYVARPQAFPRSINSIHCAEARDPHLEGAGGVANTTSPVD
jgi:hypothetical protein